jgi:stage II sporulation protein M
MVKRNMFKFFKENYSKSWKHLLESKKFIWYAFVLFLISALIGFIFPTPEFLRTYLIEMIQNLTGQLEGLNGFEITRYIFFNNLKASFFAAILGIVFGVFPLFVVLSNGYLIGFVSKIVTAQEGIFVLWRLLPHGIFEIPAVLISIGLGLKLGSISFQLKKYQNIKKEFIELLRVFVFIVLPLLIVAAIIEGILVTFTG